MRAALTAASLIVAAGCGGGGGGAGSAVTQPNPPAPPASPVVPASAGGIWFVPGTPETAVTLFVAENGELKIFDQGWFGTGAVIVTNGTEVAGSYERVLVQFVTTEPRSTRESCEVTGIVTPHAALSLTIGCKDRQGETVERTFAFNYDARYEQTSSLDAIAGNYKVPIAPQTHTLSISNNGEIFGTFHSGGSASCTVNGRIELVDPDFTIYGIELTLASCTGLAAPYYNNGTLSGLVVAEPGGVADGAFLMLAVLTTDDGGFAVYSLIYEPT